MKLSTKSLVVFLVAICVLLGFTKTIRAKDIIIYDDFSNNNFYDNWIVGNYTSGNNGTYSSHKELEVAPNNYIVNVYGAGESDLVEDEGKKTGWVGSSVVYKDDVELFETSSIETEFTVLDHSDDYYVFITMEFDKDNRIFLTAGNFLESNYSHVALQFEEHNSNIRCVNCPNENKIPINIGEDSTHKIKLSYNINTHIASIYFDNLSYEAEYFGFNQPAARFSFGAAVRNEDDYVNIAFNNVLIATNDVLTSNLLTVPDIKQYSLPWGPMEYDSASWWFPSDPTFARWGCALTSAAMVLQYHNHIITPLDLNNWLLNQSDGYIDGGNLNWLALSRYSLIDESPTSPALEYKPVKNHNVNALRNQTDLHQPAVARVPGHFVTVTGYDDTDFFINDPTSAFTKLSQTEDYHNGKFDNLYTYEPSQTDLSYIMITTPDDVEISGFDSENDEVGLIYTEYPIIDAVENIYSYGYPLNIYLAPKPHKYPYRFLVEGENNSEYSLKVYVYNESGEPQILELEGELTDGEQFLTLTNEGDQPAILNEKYLDFYKFLVANKNNFKKEGFYSYLLNHLVNSSNHYLANQYKIAVKMLEQMIDYTDNKGVKLTEPEIASSLTSQLEELIAFL